MSYIRIALGETPCTPSKMRWLALLLMLAILAAAPTAQACQLICQVTNATYTGNLGGLAGADAKCAAEFPGFKFPRSMSLPLNLGIASDGGNTARGLPFLPLVSTSSTQDDAYWAGARYHRFNDVSYTNGWVSGVYSCNNWASSSTPSSNPGDPNYWSNNGGAIKASVGSTGVSLPLAHVVPESCANAHPLICCNM